MARVRSRDESGAGGPAATRHRGEIGGSPGYYLGETEDAMDEATAMAIYRQFEAIATSEMGQYLRRYMLGTLFGPIGSKTGPVVVEAECDFVAFPVAASLSIPTSKTGYRPNLVIIVNWTAQMNRVATVYATSNLLQNVTLPDIGTGVNITAYDDATMLATYETAADGTNMRFKLAPGPEKAGTMVRFSQGLLQISAPGVPIHDNQSVGSVSGGNVRCSNINVNDPQTIQSFNTNACDVLMNVPISDGIVYRQGTVITKMQPPDSQHNPGDQFAISKTVRKDLPVGGFSMNGMPLAANLPSGKVFLSATGYIDTPGIENIQLSDVQAWDNPTFEVNLVVPGTSGVTGNIRTQYGATPDAKCYDGPRFSGINNGVDQALACRVEATYYYSNVVNDVWIITPSRTVKDVYSPQTRLDTPVSELVQCPAYCVSLLNKTELDLSCLQPNINGYTTNTKTVLNGGTGNVNAGVGVAAYTTANTLTTAGNIFPPPIGPTCVADVPSSVLLSFCKLYDAQVNISPPPNPVGQFLGVLLSVLAPQNEATNITGAEFQGMCTFGVPRTPSATAPNATIQFAAMQTVPIYPMFPAIWSTVNATGQEASLNPGTGNYIGSGLVGVDGANVTNPTNIGTNSISGSTGPSQNRVPLSGGLAPKLIKAVAQTGSNTWDTFSWPSTFPDTGAGRTSVNPLWTTPGAGGVQTWNPLTTAPIIFTNALCIDTNGAMRNFCPDTLSVGTPGVILLPPPPVATAYPTFVPAGVSGIPVANQTTVRTGTNYVCKLPGGYYPADFWGNQASVSGATFSGGALGNLGSNTFNGPSGIGSAGAFQWTASFREPPTAAIATQAAALRQGTMSTFNAGPIIGATGFAVGAHWAVPGAPSQNSSGQFASPGMPTNTGNFANSSSITLPIASPLGYHMRTRVPLCMPPNLDTTNFNTYLLSTFTNNAYTEPRGVNLVGTVKCKSIVMKLYGDRSGECGIFKLDQVGEGNVVQVNFNAVLQGVPTTGNAQFAVSSNAVVPKELAELWKNVWENANRGGQMPGLRLARVARCSLNEQLRRESIDGTFGDFASAMGLTRHLGGSASGGAWSLGNFLSKAASSIGNFARQAGSVALPIAKQIAMQTAHQVLQNAMNPEGGMACDACPGSASSQAIVQAGNSASQMVKSGRFGEAERFMGDSRVRFPNPDSGANRYYPGIPESARFRRR